MGDGVGVAVGLGVGDVVGDVVGSGVGVFVGEVVGVVVGVGVGASVGVSVGEFVGHPASRRRNELKPADEIVSQHESEVKQMPPITKKPLQVEPEHRSWHSESDSRPWLVVTKQTVSGSSS